MDNKTTQKNNQIQTKQQAKNNQPAKKDVKAKKSNINMPIGIVLGGSFIVIGIVCLLWLSSILPTKAANVQKARSEVLSVEMSSQDETLLMRTIEETQEDRTKLIEAFPDEEALLNFISIIDNLNTYSVEVVKFSLDSDVPTKIGRNPSFLPMSLIVRGSQKNVETALKAITDSQYLIRPISYNINFDPENNQVVVQTQIHLYVSDSFVKTKTKS